MVKRLGGLLAVALLAVFVLAACGSDDEGDAVPTVTRIPDEEVANLPVAGATPPPGGEGGAPAPPAEAGPPVALDVEMVDIAYTQTELTVAAGAAVTVNLVNNGAAAHNFTIEELGVSSGDYAAGQTGTVEFTAPAEPGEYQYVCTIPGHREAGMVGTLIVTAGAAPAAEAPAAPPAADSPAAGASPVSASPVAQASPQAPPPAASPAAEAPAADAAAAGGPVVLDVSMVDIAFEQTELRVPANTDVTIRLVNNGVAPHNFNVDDLGVQSGDYAPGQTGEVTFNSGAPGTYRYICSLPGHVQAGMVGSLIVE